MKNLNEIIDLSKYPINKTDSSEYKDLIENNTFNYQGSKDCYEYKPEIISCKNK